MSAVLLKLDSYMRGLVRIAAIVATSVLLAGSLATPTRAQCVDRDERAPPAAISAFVSDPLTFLRVSKNDRAKLSGRLTGLLVTDIAALDPVRDMLREASQDDRIAIGIGLHRAQERCIGTKPDMARRIGDFVAKLHDSSVLKGYYADKDALEAPSPDPSAANSNAANSSNAPAGSNSSTGLMSGEWKTELADPFKSLPLPE